MIYEVRFAAGIPACATASIGREMESPKCEGPDGYRDVDGLAASRLLSGSPAAAYQDLLLKTFYSIQLEQTTTKYYSHV